MVVGTLVRLACVIVTAPDPDVMLIAELDLLQALHLVLVVIERLVNALAGAIAQDLFLPGSNRLVGRSGGGLMLVDEWKILGKIGDTGPSVGV
jgi:hypothetical protein